MSWGATVLVALAAAVFAHAATSSSYAGAAACARCHADQQRQWSQSRHSKMVQPATAMGGRRRYGRRRSGRQCKLDPEVPAQYCLAYAYAQQGKLDEARKLLQAIPRADPQFARAQRLLQAIAGR